MQCGVVTRDVGQGVVIQLGIKSLSGFAQCATQQADRINHAGVPFGIETLGRHGCAFRALHDVTNADV